MRIELRFIEEQRDAYWGRTRRKDINLLSREKIRNQNLLGKVNYFQIRLTNSEIVLR